MTLVAHSGHLYSADVAVLVYERIIWAEKMAQLHVTGDVETNQSCHVWNTSSLSTTEVTVMVASC